MSTPRELREEILDALQGSIEPVKPAPVYRAGLALVALVMVLLPLFYLALIGLIAWGIRYHAVHHVGMLAAGGGSRGGTVRGLGYLFLLIVYLAPIVIGALLIGFLLKPLASRKTRRGKAVALSRNSEPYLFAFVDEVCEAVGAVQPARIEIDCNVNAAAAFRHGAWSMITNDLVLVIGAPLIAGLNVQEFASVVAHEFGHFTQAAGMRLSYIIRSISLWLTRVVYERDDWDYRLMDLCARADVRIGWVLYVARFFIWLTRKVLWGFMMVGHLVSSFLLRQMECDADLKSIRLAGSDAFISSTRQIALLNLASQVAQDNLAQFHREGRLPDNLPLLVLINARQLPPKVEATVTEQLKKGVTGWLDTHPCDRERAAQARSENEAGLFHCEQPASLLFLDFPKVSIKATMNLYRFFFGAGIKRQAIQPIEGLLAGHGEEMEAYKALQRYFQAAFQPGRALPLPAWGFSSRRPPNEVAVQLRQCRKNVEKLSREYVKACVGYEAARKNDKSLYLDDMELFESTAGQRLFAALELLHAPGMEKRISQAPAWRRETATLLPALKTLSNALEATAKAKRLHRTMEKLLTGLAADPEDADLFHRLRRKTNEGEGLLVGLRLDLGAADYPFEHNKGLLSIAAFALPDYSPSEDPVATYHALGDVVHCVYRLRARVVGRLCVFAEQVELALGLGPLPEANPIVGSLE
jgi:Zn-dependent protease with chaperone function